MKAKLYIVFLLIFGLSTNAIGQIEGIDSTSVELTDSLLIALDSTKVENDTLKKSVRNYVVSKDSLDAPVETSARDSMEYDIANKQMRLYGEAQVNYTSIQLKADFILLDYETNTVTAEGRLDSLGNLLGMPEFSDGNETFNAKKIKYNFRSRKGIITEATSRQDDVYILSKKGKFVAKDPTADSTSTKAKDVIYSQNSIFTSCDLDHPHYGIRSNRQKVIPGETVVVGRSNIEIGGVPTPLWLPFGFFPVTETARAGLIFPRDYEYNPLYGFGLKNVGYFTPLGENWNLQLTGDIYFKRAWGVHARTQYKKIHKYNGSISFDYGREGQENSEGIVVPRNSFEFSMRHNQDRSAHPTITFGGSVKFARGNYSRAFRNDFNSVVNNRNNSTLNFTYAPTDKPWNLTGSLIADQNLNSGLTNINFPDLNFNMRRIYPLKRKNPIGAERWYEKIGVTYKASMKNKYSGIDSTLFMGDWWNDMEYGARQSADVNTTFNVLKYFRITPNASYGHTYYFKSRDIEFDPTNILTPIDTVYNDPLDSTDFSVNYDTTYGRQFIDTMLNDFKTLQQFRAGVSMSFDVFSTAQFKAGRVRGIRHFAKPTISYNYSPNFQAPRYGYIDSTRFDSRLDSMIAYNRFLQNGVFGSPSISGRQSSIGFSLSNVVQSKYLSKKDSSTKYLNIIDEFSFNGSYNMANRVDDNPNTLPWSTINSRFRANWFKGLIPLQVSLTFDPYERDENGRTDNLVWRSSNRSGISKFLPFEFVNASFPLTNRFSVRKIRNWIEGVGAPDDFEVEDEERNEREKEKPNLAEGADFWDLFNNFSLTHNITFNVSRLKERDEVTDQLMSRDTFRITSNSLRLRGDLQLTPNWRVGIDYVSYDFTQKRLVYPSFTIYRDLHCWEMGLGWQPFRNTYSFYLRVKPGTLGFIEVPYKQPNYRF